MQLARHNSELFQLRDRCQNEQSSLVYFDGILLSQKKTIAVFTIYGAVKLQLKIYQRACLIGSQASTSNIEEDVRTFNWESFGAKGKGQEAKELLR